MSSSIPIGELRDHLIEINALKDMPVILVRYTDERPANAAASRCDPGFRDVQGLCGGVERWNKASLVVKGRTALGQT